MDRFQYNSSDGEEPEEFSSCASCRKTIYFGDSYINHYGVISCPELRCHVKVTDSSWRIAGDDDEN